MSYCLTMPMAVSSHAEPEANADASDLWMQALAGGDTAAMDCLLKRWWKPLMSYFLRSTHSAADAEELTLSTLTRLYHSAPRYRPGSSFSAYLFTIARNLLISHLRREGYRRQSLVSLEDLPDRKQPADEGSEHPINETREQFEQLLELLPEVQRTALLLRVQQSLPYEAIAEVTGLSVSATKTCLYRARQTLKAHLRNGYE